MAKENPGFEIVGGTEVEQPPAPAANGLHIAMLTIALKALSQRALAGVSDLFSLILVGLTAFLAWHVLDNPSPQQMITVFGFAFFCLLIDGVRRRGK